MRAVPHKFSVTQDGTTVMIYHPNKNEGIPAHSHSYSHLTICTAGSCIVRKEGKEKVINKDSQPLNLVAGEEHEIEALEDNTVFLNIFAEDKY